jgi:hypothetical protein
MTISVNWSEVTLVTQPCTQLLGFIGCSASSSLESPDPNPRVVSGTEAQLQEVEGLPQVTL